MLGAIRPPCDAGVIRSTPTFLSGLSQQRKRLTLAATILGSSMAFNRRLGREHRAACNPAGAACRCGDDPMDRQRLSVVATGMR